MTPDEPELHVRPLPRCELLPDGQPGLITIRGMDYTLLLHSELPERGGPRILGYRMINEESGKVYDLRLEGPNRDLVCDCPASEFAHNAPCKHSLAILNLCRRGLIPFPDDY